MSKAVYKILKDEELILEYYSGLITIDDIFRLKGSMHRDPNYRSTFNVIHDFIDAKLDIHESELSVVSEFLNEHPEIIDKRKGACISNRPHDVAISMLVSFIFKRFPISIEVFETLEAALRWMEIELEKLEFVENYFRKLKNQGQNILV